MENQSEPESSFALANMAELGSSPTRATETSSKTEASTENNVSAQDQLSGLDSKDPDTESTLSPEYKAWRQATKERHVESAAREAQKYRETVERTDTQIKKIAQEMRVRSEKQPLDARVRTDRLADIRSMIQTASPEGDIKAHYLVQAEKFEHDPHPYAPTLGIEIEVYNPTLLTEQQKLLPQVEQKQILAEKFKLFEEVRELGIPRDDSDPDYWEVALRPAHNYRMLLREVQALKDLDLINLEDHYFPMHLNIGGIHQERSQAGQEGALVLARALESSGWATSSYRLDRPFAANKPIWTGPGVDAGVLNRSSDAVIGGGQAIEIRTLQIQGMENLYRTLSASFYLGAALAAYQDQVRPIKGHQIPLPREGSNDTETDALSDVWFRFKLEIEDIFARHELRSPSEKWKSPKGRKHLPSTRGDFGVLADLLLSSEQDSEGPGRDFTDDIQGLIIAASTKIAAIIEPR